MVICGATLYMILGGLSLDSASQEQLRLRELALTAQLEALRSQLNHHFCSIRSTSSRRRPPYSPNAPRN